MRALFVAVFLSLIAWLAYDGATRWPLTSWRLFSTVRGPTQSGWEAVVVRPSGDEAAVPFDRMGRGYWGALHVLYGFPRMSPVERDAVCRAWLDGARRVGEPVASVRVYRTHATVSMGSSPTTTVVRELAHQC